MVANPQGSQHPRRLNPIAMPMQIARGGSALRSLAVAVGRVVGLFISPGIGERMWACSEVRALAGKGLEGDRYALGVGSYSRAARPVARHVSLIGREAMNAANVELSRRGLVPFEPGETRRNIVVEGIDVYALLGLEFHIGGACLRGSDITKPCHVPSAAAGKTGFKEAYHDRGGILAEVLSDGRISIGDVLIAKP